MDSSCLVAIAFAERGASALASRLKRFDRLISSNLVEAELRSALAREGRSERGERLLSWITWIYPDRPLTAEIDRVLAAGYVRGADLWHLANALFLAPRPADVVFATLDGRQREIATTLGFGA